MPNDEVPTWDGDPSSFETFATSCQWFEASLKDTERKLAAPRIWQKLSGSAKSVARHLDPQEFSTANGVTKLLGILRESPLQKLPVPDSFQRLERWTGLRRTNAESIAQLLVREEDLFVELQQALKRARQERERGQVKEMGVGGMRERDPSQSPTRPPQGFPSTADVPDEAREEAAVSSSPKANETSGFFEDELRGYRLLKAARLNNTEKQHILTLTKNSTHFRAIRRALRTLFSDETMDDGRQVPKRTVWYADEPWNETDEWWSAAGETWDDSEVYWTADEWAAYSWDSWDDSDWGWHEEESTASPSAAASGSPTNASADVSSEVDEKQRLAEAYALAQEANKTLAEAKRAVASVRAARGYYDSSGLKGSPAGKGKRASSKGKGKKGYGACFICGGYGHSYKQCPDRFGPKAKGKGKVHYVVYEDYPVPDVNVLQMHDCFELQTMDVHKAIIDTGATESVAGVACMARLVDDGNQPYTVCLRDRPTFRFGNGMTQQAVSKISLLTPALQRSFLLFARWHCREHSFVAWC